MLEHGGNPVCLECGVKGALASFLIDSFMGLTCTEQELVGRGYFLRSATKQSAVQH